MKLVIFVFSFVALWCFGTSLFYFQNERIAIDYDVAIRGLDVRESLNDNEVDTNELQAELNWSQSQYENCQQRVMELEEALTNQTERINSYGERLAALEDPLSL